MSTELVKHEPIKLPDPRRPGILPSLPAWVERSSAAARIELQLSQDGKKFEDALILPKELMLNPAQRRETAEHVDNLRCYLRQTPALDVTAETRTATAVTKLIVVLAGEKKSDLSNDARSEVYLEVLDDVPCWAVEAAVKAWFKHDCGTDERGRPHDYKWAPDPGTLRKIAQREAFTVSARIGKLQRVIDAREYVDCSKQLEAGSAAWHGLRKAMAAGEDISRMTFDEAIQRDSAPIKSPAAPPPADPATEAAE